MGLFLVKSPIKWWLGIGTLLTFLFSMGSNAEIINRFFFDYVPLFNKFRTPNSVLSVTVVLVVALAMLGLAEIIQQRDRQKEVLRSLYIALGITSSIALFFAFFGSGIFDFTTAQESQYQQIIKDALVADRKSMMQRDALRSLLIVVLTAGLVWAFVQHKIQLLLLTVGLGLITLVDLFQVGRRYVDNSDFIAQRNYDQRFQPRPVDQQILAVEPHRGAYRVMDYSINTFNVSSTSYFHNTIGGHHAAKLQRIQDIIDRHISQQNSKVLDMFNTKYIIFGEPGKEQIQQNPNALGNAWFIDSILIVPNANAEIDGLTAFNPATQVIVHQDFEDYLKGFDPSPNGNILLTDYQPDHLTYQSTSTSEQLAVFSEVWYDKGWKVLIDDAPADYIRANYILRALRVPAGTHKIEFKFEPKTYAQGRTISFIASSIIVLLLIGYLGYQLYQTFSTLPKTAKVATPKVDAPTVTPVKKVNPAPKPSSSSTRGQKPKKKR
ncbi:MAG: YfhO family protein [Saprospiraceae bacterium]|nr:YfhO family protein [Saprospiraceae bacterium]